MYAAVILIQYLSLL